MKLTAPAIISHLGLSSHSPNAYDDWFLNAQWMTTVTGTLAVASPALCLAQGQPVSPPPGLC